MATTICSTWNNSKLAGSSALCLRRLAAIDEELSAEVMPKPPAPKTLNPKHVAKLRFPRDPLSGGMLTKWHN